MAEKNDDRVEIVLDSEKRDNVQEKAEEAREYLAGFEDFVIEDDEDLGVAVECLKDVKKSYKEIKAEQELATKPMNAALKQVRSWFKPALDVLSSTEKLLKDRVADYHQRVEERSRKAMEEAAAASAAGDFDGAHEASKAIQAAPQSKGVTNSWRWDYDIEDLSQVPREFLAVDHGAVRMYLKKAGKGEPKAIPGLKFFKKTSVTVRTG